MSFKRNLSPLDAMKIGALSKIKENIEEILGKYNNYPLNGLIKTRMINDIYNYLSEKGIKNDISLNKNSENIDQININIEPRSKISFIETKISINLE